MPLKTHIDEQPTLNLTSMIDVVFLLLIFFLVGTKFSEMEHQIPLKIPQVSDSGALTSAPDNRVVNVYQDGEITLDKQTVTLKELTQQLTAARSQYAALGVQVRGDASSRYQSVVEVLNACKKADISDLYINVRIGPEEGTTRK
jgi:biopolymer transport protein ExbD